MQRARVQYGGYGVVEAYLLVMQTARIRIPLATLN